MSTEAGNIPVLSIGIVVDGTASGNAWDKAAIALTGKVREVLGDDESPLRLNVVFHIAGDWVAPKFVGVRTGSYSSVEALLVVQAAVPKEVSADLNRDLFKLLEMSVDRAESYAKRKKISGSLPGLRNVVDRLRGEWM
ncbi:hypothetical protein [Kutzneria sp. NPDC052558]|uniref:hypothetical protein n=1 Tax=Kutzneria sp. NPDC052558 TaxID=3364121 RepID=UPI0037C7FB21